MRPHRLGCAAYVVVLAMTLCACAERVPAANALKSATPHSLVVATWNLEWLNREDGAGKVPRTAEDYERLASYARRLDADIVALQEIDGKDAAARVFDPETYDLFVTGDEGNLQRTGFACKKWLHVVPQPDVEALAIGRTRRGADILVRDGEIGFRLLSIHLKTGCWEDPLETKSQACEILNSQLAALKRWIDARTYERVPFAVLGDFNRRFTFTDSFFPALDFKLPADAQLYDVAMSHRSQCWGGEYPVYIDHLVLGQGMRDWVISDSFNQVLFDSNDVLHKAQLSDHCPIAVKLRLGGRP